MVQSRNNVNLPIFSLFIFLSLFSLTNAVQYLSSCKTSGWIAGETYLLTQNVSSTGTCMNINANNIILDCQGYSITFGTNSNSTLGVYVNNYNNITIKNCKIFQTNSSVVANVGVWLTSQNSSVINNTIQIQCDNCGGLNFNYASSNYVINTTIRSTHSTGFGIRSFSSSNNLIFNNIINSTSSQFLVLDTNLNYLNTTIINVTNIVNGPFLGGNFWANPSGTGFSQTCIDQQPPYGICDSSYTVNSNNIDYLPLAVPPIQVTSCGTLDQAGKTYILTQNVSSSGTCINIAANNITLDCQGYTVNYGTGSNNSYGIYSLGYNNSVIKNCRIIQNTSLRNNVHGIWFAGSSNNRVENTSITVIGNQSNGIYLTFSWPNSANNNVIRNVTINMTGVQGHGIGVQGNYNNFSNISILTSGSYANGINFGSSSDYDSNSFINMTIRTTGSGGYGIFLRGNSNLFYNNIINASSPIFILSGTNLFNTTKTPGTNIVNGPFLGGNFWANPSGTGFSQTCTDSNADGICDSQYTLDSNNIDYLPLTYPPIQISSCGTLDQAGRTYILTQNVSDSPTCFTIAANNVTLDCQGYTIHYGGTGGQGIYVDSVSGLKIRNCKIIQTTQDRYDGSKGIYLWYTSNSSISNVTIFWSGTGIRLYNSNSIISNSNITFTLYGIFSGGANSIVFNNTLTSNIYGIRCEGTNIIFYNNFFNNSNNVWLYYSGPNFWNTTLNCSTSSNIVGGSCIGGNFWANPSGTGFSETCTDINLDGICDSQYTLDSNNIDYLPLAVPPIQLNSCGTLDQAGKTYILTQNVSSSGTCITIAANNITLDCQGYTINYSTSGGGGLYGIRVDQYNYTKIRNCIVNQVLPTSASHGIFIASNYAVISNTSVYTTGPSSIGIYLSTTQNSNLTFNNIIASGSNAQALVLGSGSEYNLLVNNTLKSVNGVDFYSWLSGKNTAVNMTFNLSYPVTVSFYYDSMGESPVNIQFDSTSPIPSPGYHNVSKYLNITNSSPAWVFINFSYSNDTIGENETKLKLYRWDGSSWNLVPGSGVDTVNKIVYGNITQFSVFAPLAVADATPPSIQLISPANDTYTNDNNMTFVFNATDDQSSTLNCSLYINNTLNQTNSSVANGSLTSFSLTSIADGDYTWRINCSDASGNSNVSETRTLAIDKYSPFYPRSCIGTLASGSEYRLSRSVYAAGTCFNIQSGATLDCQGYTIYYANTSVGYAVNSSNASSFVIKNCRMQQINSSQSNSHAIYLYNTSNALITNNTINATSGSSNGIFLDTGAGYSNVTLNSISAGGHGLNLNGISNIRSISNNLTATGSSSYGIRIQSGSLNYFEDNRVNGSYGDSYVRYGNNNTFFNNSFLKSGIQIDQSTGNVIDSNFINSTGTSKGVSVVNGDNTSILGNTIVGANGIALGQETVAPAGTGVRILSNTINVSSSGISIARYTNGILIDSNRIITYSQAGIGTSNEPGIYNITIVNNNISGSYGAGIEINGAYNNSISNNRINVSNAAGVRIMNGARHTVVSNNNVTSRRALSLESSANNITVQYNNFEGSDLEGIYITGATNNSFLSNNITSSTANAVYILSGSNLNIFSGNRISAPGASTNGLLISGSNSNSFNSNIFNSTGTNGIAIRLQSNSNFNNFTDNNITSTNSYGLSLTNSHNNSISNNRITGRIYGIYFETSSNNSISFNNITRSGSSGQSALYLYSNSSNNKLEYNNIDSTNSRAIWISSNSNSNEFIANNITGNVFGLFVTLELYSYYNRFVSNNIQNLGTGMGINLFSYSDFNVFENNLIQADNMGMWIATNYNNISNNTIISINNNSINLYGAIGNRIISNVIKSVNSIDFYSPFLQPNEIYNLTLNGSSYPTPISFIGNGAIFIDSSDGAPDNGLVNVSRYVNVTNLSSETWILLNVSYSDETYEDKLRMYRWTGSAWQFIDGSGVDTANNVAYANLSQFSIIAPLADIAPPTVSIFSPNSSTISNSRIITISGSSSDDYYNYTNISIWQGINLINSTITTNNSWSVQLQVPSDGIYNITATAYDKTGNNNSITVTNIAIDATSPTISISSPSSNSYLNSKLITISGSSSDINYNYTNISIWQGSSLINSTITSDSSWTVQLGAENDGIYSITATAYDKAGNSNTTAVGNITVDTIAPEVIILNPLQSNPAYLRSGVPVQVRFAYNEINPANYTVLLINGSGAIVSSVSNNLSISGNFNVTAYLSTTGLQNGNYSINISVFDKAGYETKISEQNNVKIDNEIPGLLINYPQSGKYIIGDAIKLNLTVFDDNLNYTIISISNASESILNYTTLQSGTFAVDFTLPDGVYSIDVISYDLSGNNATAGVTDIELDSTTPFYPNECIEIIYSGEYYLSSDIYAGSSCIIVSADDVMIEGQGRKIINTGSPGNIGIYAENRNNLTIRNIIVQGFEPDIKLVNMTNVTLVNVTHNGGQLELTGSQALIMNSRFENSTSEGIVANVSNITINNTVVKDSQADLLRIISSNVTMLNSQLQNSISANAISVSGLGAALYSENNRIQTAGNIISFNVEESDSASISISESNISTNSSVIRLINPTNIASRNISIKLFRNNINFSKIAASSLPINASGKIILTEDIYGNYWGRSSYPYTADSDFTNVTGINDHYPFMEESGWNKEARYRLNSTSYNFTSKDGRLTIYLPYNPSFPHDNIVLSRLENEVFVIRNSSLMYVAAENSLIDGKLRYKFGTYQAIYVPLGERDEIPIVSAKPIRFEADLAGVLNSSHIDTSSMIEYSSDSWQYLGGTFIFNSSSSKAITTMSIINDSIEFIIGNKVSDLFAYDSVPPTVSLSQSGNIVIASYSDPIQQVTQSDNGEGIAEREFNSDGIFNLFIPSGAVLDNASLKITPASGAPSFNISIYLRNNVTSLAPAERYYFQQISSLGGAIELNATQGLRSALGNCTQLHNGPYCLLYISVNGLSGGSVRISEISLRYSYSSGIKLPDVKTENTKTSMARIPNSDGDTFYLMPGGRDVLILSLPSKAYVKSAQITLAGEELDGSYPSDVSIWIGNGSTQSSGTPFMTYNGQLNTSVQIMAPFANALRNHLSLQPPDDRGEVIIPLTLNSSTKGKVRISSVTVDYDLRYAYDSASPSSIDRFSDGNKIRSATFTPLSNSRTFYIAVPKHSKVANISLFASPSENITFNVDFLNDGIVEIQNSTSVSSVNLTSYLQNCTPSRFSMPYGRMCGVPINITANLGPYSSVYSEFEVSAEFIAVPWKYTGSDSELIRGSERKFDFLTVPSSAVKRARQLSLEHHSIYSLQPGDVVFGYAMDMAGNRGTGQHTYQVSQAKAPSPPPVTPPLEKVPLSGWMNCTNSLAYAMTEPGAYVTVIFRPTGRFVTGGVADSNGRFEFTPTLSGDYVIRASKTGFEDNSIVLSAATCEIETQISGKKVLDCSGGQCRINLYMATNKISDFQFKLTDFIPASLIKTVNSMIDRLGRSFYSYSYTDSVISIPSTQKISSTFAVIIDSVITSTSPVYDEKENKLRFTIFNPAQDIETDEVIIPIPEGARGKEISSIEYISADGSKVNITNYAVENDKIIIKEKIVVKKG